MNILLTTWRLADHTGAELHLRDLARGFQRRGHSVAVYAVNPGALAKSLIRDGVDVVSDMRRLARPDIIHAHHQPALLDALHHFPLTPAVYVIHDATSPLDEPFAFPRLRRHVAVDQRCLARIQTAGAIGAAETTVLLNFVDLARFKPRPALPAKPRRALVFSNYATEANHLIAIRQACAGAGLELDVVGKGVGRQTTAPEGLLGDYDLVFAKARAAIEAMAVGCAVVVCDFAGLGEMVTSSRFDALRAWNFGAGMLTRPVEAAAIREALDTYDPADATVVSARIRAEAGLEAAVDRWLALYAEVLAEPVQPDGPAERAILRTARRRWAGLRRVDWLRSRGAALKQDRGIGGALYRSGRAIWRRLGSPGQMA